MQSHITAYKATAEIIVWAPEEEAVWYERHRRVGSPSAADSTRTELRRTAERVAKTLRPRIFKKERRKWGKETKAEYTFKEGENF